MWNENKRTFECDICKGECRIHSDAGDICADCRKDFDKLINHQTELENQRHILNNKIKDMDRIILELNNIPCCQCGETGKKMDVMIPVDGYGERMHICTDCQADI